MKNYGIASTKVEILSELPYVSYNPTIFGFDVNASIYEEAMKEGKLNPLLITHIKGETLDACCSNPRKMMINNYLSNGTVATPGDPNPPSDVTVPTLPYILWTPVMNSMTISGILFNLIEGLESYPLVQPQASGLYPSDYIGPQWTVTHLPFEAEPNDTEVINFYRSYWGLTNTDEIPPSYIAPSDKQFAAIYQSVPKDGLWWGIESSNFLTKNMPFWLTIKKHSSPPQSSNNPTWLLICFGANEPVNSDNRFDLYIQVGNETVLKDYRIVEENNTIQYSSTKPFDNKLPIDKTKIFDSDSVLELGFMTIAKSLVIFFNRNIYIYTRSKPFKSVDIAAGPIRIYGSNIAATIYASPMVFPGVGYLPIPIVRKQVTSISAQPQNIVYKACDQFGNVINKPVCVLPKSDGDTTNGENNIYTMQYGVDCETFIDSVGTAHPEGDGYHKEGGMIFKPSSEFGSTNLDTNGEYFILGFYPQFNAFPQFPDEENYRIRNACPYFFRLKGAADNASDIREITTYNVTDYVETVEETTVVGDDEETHLKKNATITLYNKDGAFDYLKKKQYGIRIYWGWNGNLTRTFTGIINTVTSTEIPGRETISLSCEDYMYILSSQFIINSPIYDGMLAYYVIKDEAKRAGITEFVNDWPEETERFFLPSGYSFSAPVWKEPDYKKILECIINVAKRNKAYVFFDGDGKMHIAHVPGGLLGYTESEIVNAAEFTIDPANTDPSKVLLDEKSITVDYSETVNHISAMTIEPVNRTVIIEGLSASAYGQEQNPPVNIDTLRFKKVLYNDSAMYGWDTTLREMIRDWAKRIFFPTREVNFKITGSGQNIILPVPSYIKIDGASFKMIELKRSYNAESNDFNISIGAQWIGGA